MNMMAAITAKRQPCVSAYRRSVREAEIQHQFAPDGIITPMPTAMDPVAKGTIHMDKQISIFFVREIDGR